MEAQGASERPEEINTKTQKFYVQWIKGDIKPEALTVWLPNRNLTPENLAFRSRLLSGMTTKHIQFPVASAVFYQLQQLLSDVNAELSSFCDIIKTDISLTSRFLRMASSSFYGGINCETLEEALLRLGLGEVRRIAILPTLRATLESFHPNTNFELEWSRSLLVARLTDQLCGLFFRTNGSEYLSGLLHDTGLLLMSKYFREDYQRALDCAASKSIPDYEAEKETLGLSHANLSGMFCAYWGLGRRVCNAVTFHHEFYIPADAEPSKSAMFVSGAISLCDAVARTAGFGKPNPGFENFNAIADHPLYAPYKSQLVNLDIEREIRAVKSLIS